MSSPTSNFRSGLVAIVGRANVGKSTLLNALLGQKLSIVSAKPHTTRHRLLGVLNGSDFQAALIDTPGFLRKGRDQLDAAMARQLAGALSDAHAVVLAAEPRYPGDVEQALIAQIAVADVPALLAITKTDTVAKNKLLPVMARYAEAHPFAEIVPVSALQRDGLAPLADMIGAHLPEQDALFPPEMLTDRTTRFLVGELVREKIFELYAHEVPYDTAVEVVNFDERQGETPDHIRAMVYVDTSSQKRLLIGRGGAALKEVGVLARPEIEALTGRPAFLELWVKVNARWRRKAGFIQRTL
ncbi:MAG: GTPase Era [Chloroflexota bacterium]|nr:GTPase Era [Chloroflexota bacterium]MDE2884674.1 GTPase Era [Chloroflexota bacterium]